MGALPDSTMVARRLAVLSNRIYASPTYLARHGEPAHPFELQRHLALVTRVARRGRGYAWSMSNGGAIESYEISPVIEADDPEVLKAALFAGAGLMNITMHRHTTEGLVSPILPGWLGRCPELHAVFPRDHLDRRSSERSSIFLAGKLSTQGAIAAIGQAH